MKTLEKRINCHVFIKDGETFKGNICITGDCFAGDNVTIQGNVDAEGKGVFGNNLRAGNIKTGDDLIIGDKGNTTALYDIESGGNIILGKNVNTGFITAKGDVTIDTGLNFYKINAGGQIYSK